MAPWKLCSVSETTKYWSFLRSWSTLLVLTFYIVLFIAPFLIIFRIGNVFPTDSDFEQPSILFKKLFHLTLKTSKNESHAISYTTINSTFKPWNFRIPTLISQELDDNGDGLNDRLYLELKIPLMSNETIHEVDLLLIFNYTLKRLSAWSESFIRIHSTQNLLRAASIEVTGHMRLVQLKALQGSRIFKFIKSNLTDNSCSDMLSPYTDVFGVISCYVNTQAYLELSDAKHSWEPVQLAERAFVIRGSIDYSGKQEVMYETNHWLALKWLYIQYAAVFLLLGRLGWCFLSYLFTSGSMDTFIKRKCS